MADNRLGSLAKQTAIYGLSSIIGRFLNYMLVTVYTFKICAEAGGPAAYGIVTNLYAYTALLLVLLTFGMETTFFRFANKEGVNPSKAFSTSGLAVGLVACAIKFATLKLLFIFMSIGMNLFIFFLAPGLKESHPALMGWYENSYQVGYIFIINLICTSLITFGFIPEIKKLRFGIDRDMLKQMLKYTWPLLLLGLAGILNQVADKICYRFIVPGEEGDRQLGIYGACVKIAMIMAMITQAFRYAYEPFVFSGHRDKNDKVLQAKVMKYFIIFTLLAFLAVVMYMPVLQYIIGPEYRVGLGVVPIVMMAEIFMGIYFNLSFWYKLIDETWWGAIFSGIGCAVLLAINFIFVPKYGYWACAWGGFAGYGTCMVLSYLVGQKKAPIPYNLKTAFVYFAIAIALYYAQKYIHIENTALTLVVNTVLLLVFVAFICWMEKDLVKGIVSFAKRKISKS